MTAQQFKSAMQSELSHEAFGNKLLKVGEDEQLHTTMEFESKVTPELFRWLNNRFKNGVSATSERVITLNVPNYGKGQNYDNN